MSPNLFLVIEGIDGVGKSTIVELLADKLGAHSLETPCGVMRKYRKLVESSHPTVRFLYYVIANYFGSSLFQVGNGMTG